MRTQSNRIGRGCAGMAAVLWLALQGANATPVTCRIELDRPVLPAGSEQKAVVKVSLVGSEELKPATRPPVNLVIVLDRSGSMSGGGKLENAKEAAIAALRRLGPQDSFALVVYDHEVETLVPAQSAANTEWIESRIRSISSRGNTALFGGVSQGAAEVRKHIEDRRYVHRIILLSDGLANVGPSTPDDLGRLGSALIKENISVTTVGVGTDYNEDLMTRLAQSSDGNTYFVESSQDLARIFSAELGDVLSVIARKVVIEIECPEGVRLERLVGRDGRIQGNRAEINLNQLYGGQTKYALLEVTVPPTAKDLARRIAVARCAYEDARTQKQERAVAEVAARFSAAESDVIQAVNQQVQADHAANTIAIAKDQTVELMDAGRKDAAVDNLRKVSTELQQQGQEFKNEALLKQSEMVEEEAKKLEKEGMDKRGRKDYRAKSYQDRNQQMSK